MTRGLFDEMQQESRAWAKTVIKPKINLTMARQAIGAQVGDSSGAPATPVAPAGKAP